MEPRAPHPDDKPRKRTFHGDPPFLVKFIIGFVFGVIAGVVIFYRFIARRGWSLDWVLSPSPWPMILFAAGCGIVCGLLAGFFRRTKRHG